MEDLSNLLKNYFSYLEKLVLLWEGVPKRVSKPINAIEILSEQLKAVSRVGPDIRINMLFPHLKEHVMFKTLMSLDQELCTIINIVQELDEATDKLNRLASSIDQHREGNYNLSISESVSKLIEYAFDCRQYYQAQFSGLKIALKCLNFRDWNSIKDLRELSNEDKNLKKHVQRCLLIGKHFIAETGEK